MRTFQTFITLLLLITTASGCAKFRQLTRRDYAQLHDPFAPKQVDSVAKAGLSDAGVTRIEDTKPAGITVADSPTDNSLSTASRSSAPRTRSLRGTNAQDGPSLTDFVSKSTRTPFATAEASGSRDNSADMAEFANFLEDEAVASGLDDTAMELDKDFTDWATTQKQEWTRQTKAGNERQQEIQQVSQSGPSKAAAGIPAFPETSISNAAYDDDVATPLILQPGQRQKIAASKAPVARPPVGSANPFADLSAEFQPGRRGQQTTTPPPVFDTSPPQPALSEPQWDASSSALQPANSKAAAFGGQPNQRQKNTIDAGFNFDSGWKPSSLSQE